jgi:membrane-anchored mycosin MYCP
MDPEMSAADELYVDTRDEVAVAKMLTCVAPTIRVASSETNADLGLTRWFLRDVATALAQHNAAGGRSPTERCRFDDGGQVRLTDLDDLINALRSHARAHFEQWCPVIDRNQDDGDVMTNPHVKIAYSEPEPVKAPELTVRPEWPDGPRVGIADAQVYAHDELAGHIVGTPLTGHGPFQSGAPGHATFVAGTVLDRAPSAVLVCGTVLEHHKPNTSWDIATRLMQFVDKDIDILNMSFGWLIDSGPPLPLRRAMDRLGARTVLVAAVGNHGTTEEPHAPIYPAAFGDVVAVGAAEADGRPAQTTPDVPWLDLLARGVGLVGPFLPGDVTIEVTDDKKTTTTKSFASGYAKWSGSSFAAAAVTGEIALRMHDRGIDAFAARDDLIAEGHGDVVPFRYVGQT